MIAGMYRCTPFVLVLFFCVVPFSFAEGWTGNVNLLLGAKMLEKDDWEPVEDQTEFGIEVDFRHESWPFNLAIDILGASATEDILGLEGESNTAEINIGPRKIWETDSALRPFFGGGLSFITGELKLGDGTTSVSLEDSATGIWIGTGLYGTVSSHFNLGFEVKFSTAEIEIADIPIEAGGIHFGILGGFHW